MMDPERDGGSDAHKGSAPLLGRSAPEIRIWAYAQVTGTCSGPPFPKQMEVAEELAQWVAHGPPSKSAAPAPPQDGRNMTCEAVLADAARHYVQSVVDGTHKRMVGTLRGRD